ncbi:MAG: DUF535 family protein [Cytophaga sp.]|nr:DUF535 family protein [Undibacterium sp.]
MQRLLVTVPLLVGSLAWAINFGLNRIDKTKQTKNTTTLKYGSTMPRVTLYSGLVGMTFSLSFVREFLKLNLRSHIHSQLSREWIAFWNSTPFFNALAIAEPSVLKKIFRPYLTKCLSSFDRLDVLTSHYQFIMRHGLGDIVLRAAKTPVVLSQFSAKSDKMYHVRLVVDNTMEREGEMVLQLVSEENILFSVAFTFFDHLGKATVAIGCIQGGKSQDNLDQIRFSTRDMFGLRPKTLMVRLVQQIGFQLGCVDMLLVGNGNRTVSQQLRKGIVFADYNSAWEELGALRRADGDFKLACSGLSAPDLQAIASSKRSEAKKRFALLGTVSELTVEGLRQK